MHEWDLPEIGLRRLSAAEMGRFWELYLAARPGIRYARGNVYSRWRAVPGSELNVALYIANRSVGLFVRGLRGVPLSATRAGLAPRAAVLEAALGARVDGEAPLLRSLRLAAADSGNWGRARAWLRQAEDEYLEVLAPGGAEPRR